MMAFEVFKRHFEVKKIVPPPQILEASPNQAPPKYVSLYWGLFQPTKRHFWGYGGGLIWTLCNPWGVIATAVMFSHSLIQGQLKRSWDSAAQMLGTSRRPNPAWNGVDPVPPMCPQPVLAHVVPGEVGGWCVLDGAVDEPVSAGHPRGWGDHYHTIA